MKVFVPQACLTFCDPTDWSQPGSSVMEFSRQEYWSRFCHLLLQRIFPTQGSNQPGSPALRAGSVPSEPPGKPSKGAGEG